MRLLLDTHICSGGGATLRDSPRLSADLRDLIGDPDHEVLVSAVSIAEIAMKKSIGRLVIEDDFSLDVARDGFTELPLTAAHASRVASLPLFHRDPFDRMLFAQAQDENSTLVTVDSAVRQYDVPTLP